MKAKDSGVTTLVTRESDTTEMLYRIFGEVLVPLDKVRTHYFRNLNEQTFLAEITSGRIRLPITTLDTSRKAIKYIHIRHIALLIETRADKAADKSSSHASPID